MSIDFRLPDKIWKHFIVWSPIPLKATLSSTIQRKTLIKKWLIIAIPKWDNIKVVGKWAKMKHMAILNINDI